MNVHFLLRAIVTGVLAGLTLSPAGVARAGVRIQDNALVSAATLSHRYITDRFLPDKAIDLVDEACAMIRTEIDSMPAELDEVTRRVMQLEIEEAALKKEKDKASRERLDDLRRELADQKEKASAMRAQWESEKKVIHEVQAIKAQIDETRQHVLMDMCFNLGTTGLLKFKAMLTAVEARDFDRAAGEMLNSTWARQVGDRAQTLAAMMKTGVA